MSRVTHRIAVCATAMVFAGAAQAGLIDIDLTDATQPSGNQGASFRPLDGAGGFAFFTLTARTRIDEFAPSDPNATVEGDPGEFFGTVNFDSDGAGVRRNGTGGSAGISGGGGDADEELIFTFDFAVRLDAIVLSLADVDFADDDPYVFLSVAGSDALTWVTIEELDLVAAFTSTGTDLGQIDFGAFTSLTGDTLIESFKLRETDGHLWVTGMTNPVPGPGTAAMLGIGAFAARRSRRRYA